jgi:hypothetical protein
VNVSGGAGGSNGGGGVFLLGDNTTNTFAGTVVGAASTLAANGSRDTNPFIGTLPQTPFIPNLPAAGVQNAGAEIYGVSSLTAAGLLGSLPATDINGMSLANASGALFRTSASILGPAFSGFDALLFINLSGNAFNSPMFGTDGALQSLLARGFTNNPAFGGGGAQLVGSLGSNAVYGTLIPAAAGTLPAMTVTSSTSGLTFAATGAALASGQALYVVPEPATWLLLAAGVFLLPVLARRRRAS